MSRARSYILEVDRLSGKKVEADAYTCGHCNQVVRVAPKAPMAGCRACAKLVCPRCDQIGTCTPFERRMEKAEARDRFRRSLGV